MKGNLSVKQQVPLFPYSCQPVATHLNNLAQNDDLKPKARKSSGIFFRWYLRDISALLFMMRNNTFSVVTYYLQALDTNPSTELMVI